MKENKKRKDTGENVHNKAPKTGLEAQTIALAEVSTGRVQEQTPQEKTGGTTHLNSSKHQIVKA